MPDQDESDSWLFGDDKPVYGAKAPKEKPVEVDPYQKQFAESQAGVLGSAAGQLAAAQKGAEVARGGLGELQKREQGALGAVRARSGQAFAGQMAQGGGGSLAGMRQAQLSRGVAEGQLMGDFGMQKIAQQRLAAQAEKEAQQAAGEYATTTQKLKQQEADRAKAQVQEVSDVEKEIRDSFNSAVENVDWWSEGDAKAFAKELREKYKTHPNKAVRDKANEIAAQIEYSDWYSPGAGTGTWKA